MQDVDVGNKSLSPWAPEFRHISFRGSLVRDRFSYTPTDSDLCNRGGAKLSEDEEQFLRFLFKEAGLDLHRFSPQPPVGAGGSEAERCVRFVVNGYVVYAVGVQSCPQFSAPSASPAV